jgi:hypothetical protein
MSGERASIERRWAILGWRVSGELSEGAGVKKLTDGTTDTLQTETP